MAIEIWRIKENMRTPQLCHRMNKKYVAALLEVGL
jgi:hypothetical protein